MGSALYGGRWNSIGNFLLYTAETSSLSILEHLVHITGADSFKYVLLKIKLEESQVNELGVLLSKNWEYNEKETNRIGNRWVKDQSSPVLKVPSVINPLENNFLINPKHPELRMEIVNQDWFVYDRRLVKN